MTTATLTPPQAGTITTPGMPEDEFALMIAAAARTTQRFVPDITATQRTALIKELSTLREPHQGASSDGSTTYLKCPNTGAHWAFTR